MIGHGINPDVVIAIDSSQRVQLCVTLDRGREWDVANARESRGGIYLAGYDLKRTRDVDACGECASEWWKRGPCGLCYASRGAKLTRTCGTLDEFENMDGLALWIAWLTGGSVKNVLAIEMVAEAGSNVSGGGAGWEGGGWWWWLRVKEAGYKLRWWGSVAGAVGEIGRETGSILYDTGVLVTRRGAVFVRVRLGSTLASGLRARDELVVEKLCAAKLDNYKPVISPRRADSHPTGGFKVRAASRPHACPAEAHGPRQDLGHRAPYTQNTTALWVLVVCPGELTGSERTGYFPHSTMMNRSCHHGLPGPLD
ncbi:hypothetical protein BD779DRAFT_1477048 [Infundibulicybe gibba]|nr:hypothetical protein BD779DRAFT_1477048 [Infundibulicybe gibba]